MHSDFEHALRERGLKATPIRLAVLRYLHRQRRPRTVDEMARSLDADVVTVYRTLDAFVRCGLAMRGIGAAGAEGDLRGDIRAAHFSYARHAHHHHLVCVDCGALMRCGVC